MSEQDKTELLTFVKENGGGSFTASVYLREDGFFVMFNSLLLERIARTGRADRFSELLRKYFEEGLENATEESKRSVSGLGGGAGENILPRVQVGN